MRIAIVAGLLLAAAQDGAKEQLKAHLKDTDIVGNWIYDDIEAGFAEAKKSGKPLLVAFR